ncbi:TonB system transport protein ExbD [Malaciobacter pacificus]|jgi:biopolymer transport protein ExbD|uniref:Biopolymer transport protein ExbD n=1 Tax=Malaciobacter pacificus TaxID=1080223 RepID=A0A5C2H705_9BACT|nr:TonB system transport protein ExbD [Malaciobacter pacificus]QEP34603.1 TonB system transport protein ExbD [Malaciobacter pacificus]GGD37449.1 TonB system transport protein ExbD [Malaciobacter pacificus]
MKLKKYDSINVIPFIDVLLVLLAIVLMTTTFISKGIIPVSLPEGKNAENIKLNKEVIITIKEEGNLLCNNNIQGLYNIENHVLQFPKDTPIHINSDKNAKFELFVSVLDMLKKNEYSNISIVTKK